MEEKRSKLPTILAVIFMLATIGLASYIIYDKFIKIEHQSETMINDVSINLNIFYEVGKTLQKLDKAFTDKNYKFYEYIYNEKKELIIAKANQEALLFAAIYDNLHFTESEEKIAAYQVKKSFQEMFGTQIQYEDNTIDLGNDIKIRYDAYQSKYIASLDKNSQESNYEIENIKTSLEEKSIVVTRKVFYKEYEKSENGTIQKAIIYKDSNKKDKIGEVSVKKDFFNKKEALNKYGSKMNTYNYIFKQSSSGEYNLYSIERIK